MDGVADAVINARETTMKTNARVTPFGLFKALGDPDVQRGLALTIEMAKGVGRQMRPEGSAPNA